MRIKLIGALVVASLAVGCQRTHTSETAEPDPGCMLIASTNDTVHKILIDACQAEAGASPWLLMHHYVMIMEMDDIAPSTIAVLPPETETKRIRRGKAFRNRKILQYAQVATAGHPFHGVYTLPAVHERPFLLYGDVSDETLVSLFDYLWEKEFPKDRYAKEYIIAVSTKHQQRGDLLGTIEVTTERGSMGQILYLKKGFFGWKIASSGRWIS